MMLQNFLAIQQNMKYIQIYEFRRCRNQFFFLGQVNPRELPETPGLTEMTENFTKSPRHKQQEKRFPWIPGFRISSMVKNNPETWEINRKLSKSKRSQC